MKKAMWIVSMLPLIATAVIMQFLPEKIPMHFDSAGNINRWGGRGESLIIPVMILAFALMWTLIGRNYEKKAEKTSDETEQNYLLSNAKMVYICGLAMNVVNAAIQGVLIYTAFTAAHGRITESPVDIGRITALVLGAAFIVIGNVMTKTRNNGVVGVRTVWSRYNDNTWRKSNLFGGIAMMVCGVVTIVTTVLAGSGFAAEMLMLVWLTVMAIATVIYSKKVYDDEIEAEKLKAKRTEE
jgi:uncharacterized membrane protein